MQRGIGRRLPCSLAEMKNQFAVCLARLRLVSDDPCRSGELWACSSYGVFRFFRVQQYGLVELDASGLPLMKGTAGVGSV